jgi:hypothetical protein
MTTLRGKLVFMNVDVDGEKVMRANTFHPGQFHCAMLFCNAHLDSLQVSIVTGKVLDVVVSPTSHVSKYVTDLENYDDIIPLKEMYFHMGSLKYVQHVTNDAINKCGLHPAREYIVAHQPTNKKLKSFSSYQGAIDHCAGGGTVCVWYESIDSVFVKNAPAQLQAFIQSVDDAAETAGMKRKRRVAGGNAKKKIKAAAKAAEEPEEGDESAAATEEEKEEEEAFEDDFLADEDEL